MVQMVYLPTWGPILPRRQRQRSAISAPVSLEGGYANRRGGCNWILAKARETAKPKHIINNQIFGRGCIKPGTLGRNK